MNDTPYMVPHRGPFSERMDAFWIEMRDHVLRLVARHGWKAVRWADVNNLVVDEERDFVQFSGTVVNIALAVDEITEKLEG